MKTRTSETGLRPHKNPIKSIAKAVACAVAFCAVGAGAQTQSSSTDIVVRAKGAAGGEHINLLIGGRAVANWTLTTSAANYVYSGRAAGDIRVEFDNDGGSRDAIVDWVYANGETREAEDMSYNTAAYGNGECGGGSNSEIMNCNGVIGFGNTDSCFSKNCGTPAPSGNTLIVRARGTSGEESVTLSVGGTAIQTWTMSTSNRDYTAVTNATGDIEVAFTNDATGRDVILDYVSVNGSIRQAEDMADNTATYSGTCGGGAYSEIMHCSGAIGFGPVSGGSSSGGSTDTTERLVVAVNAGGSATSYQGISFRADEYAAGGTANSTKDSISGGALFETERYGSYAYTVPVTNATYSVKLFFAEIYQNRQGARSFDVSVEGRTEMFGVDLYTLAGHDEPYTYEINNINVRDGVLDIELNSLIDNGTLAGFAIYSSAGKLGTLPTPAVSRENPSANCNVGSMPSSGSLPSIRNLPDPFTKMNGSRIRSKTDWRCRRQEILEQAYAYLYGEKPAKPRSVTGTVSNSSIRVNVSENGRSTSFTASVELPSTGRAPYPAVIGFGGGWFGLASGMKDVIKSQGVAVINFDPYQVGEENGGHGNGKFYDIYGSNHSAGLLTAWAWGASRIIDVMESSNVLDASKVGVSGCSRFGKAAFIAGAFDGRVALTIPNESGIGGVPALRMVPTVDPAGEQPSHAMNYQPWLSPLVFRPFANATSRLPIDTHEVLGLIAPRGVLILDNPGIDNLDYRSSYAAAVAGQRIYEALGVKNNFTYHSNTTNGSHCAWKSEFAQPLRDHLNKFLKGGSGTTGYINARSGKTINADSWIDWSTPNLSGNLDF